MRKRLCILFLFSVTSAQGEEMNYNNPKVLLNIEKKLGKQHTIVIHSLIPFEIGFESGGAADVYMYKNHLQGTVFVTGDLIGKKQKSSDAGNFEFMIIHKAEERWGAKLISKLAYYTLDSSINSGETMDIGPFSEKNNSIKAIIFDKYFQFSIGFKKYGLMLIIGITQDELEWAMKNGALKLLEKLKEKQVYPFTDLNRPSVLE